MPASILALFIVYALVSFLNRVFGYGTYSITDWGVRFFSSFTSGAAFVLAGTYVAPNEHRIVSVVLTTILSIVSVVSIFFSFYSNEGWELFDSIVFIIISAIGGISGCYQIYKDEKE